MHPQTEPEKLTPDVDIPVRPPRSGVSTVSGVRGLGVEEVLVLKVRIGVATRTRGASGERLQANELAAAIHFLIQDDFARSSRAIVRYPTWIATTTSRPRRPLACSAQGTAARGVTRPFSPGATSSWIAAASSLACSRHPPPAPRMRVATLILTSRTKTSSTPKPRTPDTVLTPVRGGRTGMSTSGVSFFVFFF